jgi:hypothetical protein
MTPDPSKLHYIVHVQPQNLRDNEHAVSVHPELPMLPVWVIRPECARDRTALVYNWAIVNGTARSHTTPLDPLPDTGGHGWAYIECDALLVQTDPNEADGWKDAAYLFVGVCSPVGVGAASA